MRSFSIFLFIFLLIFFNTFEAYEEKKNVKSLLAQISSEDRDAIEQFFRYMVLHEQFGYVIFGSKPMTWDGFELSLLDIDLKAIKSKVIKYNKLKHNYLTWKKYEHLFPMKNFILKIFNFTEEDFPYVDLIFINIKNFLEVTQNNLSLFKKVLGQSISPIDVLHKVEITGNLLSGAMKGSAALTGILLGFGNHNSLVYQSMDDLWEKHWHPPYDYHLFEEARCIKLTPFPELFDNIKYPTFIELPYYGEDRNHPESIQIRESYKKTTEMIIDIYAKENFLEIILMALTK